MRRTSVRRKGGDAGGFVVARARGVLELAPPVHFDACARAPPVHRQ